jgi:hypothetical protein
VLSARPATGAQVGDETSASSSSLNVEGVDVAVEGSGSSCTSQKREGAATMS